MTPGTVLPKASLQKEQKWEDGPWKQSAKVVWGESSAFPLHAIGLESSGTQSSAFTGLNLYSWLHPSREAPLLHPLSNEAQPLSSSLKSWESMPPPHPPNPSMAHGTRAKRHHQRGPHCDLLIHIKSDCSSCRTGYNTQRHLSAKAGLWCAPQAGQKLRTPKSSMPVALWWSLRDSRPQLRKKALWQKKGI